MAANTMQRLTTAEVDALDPYLFMAVLGKRVIHPGGRVATQELIQRGDFQAGQRVLDVGCGVGTTAIELARRHDAQVTAVDIEPLMLHRARANVEAAGLPARVAIQQGDILDLAFPDHAFDRVIAEAVTMFVDRPRAVRELVRVCRPGGRVLTTEFFWRRPPPPKARHIFFDEVCPGMTFDTLDDWLGVFAAEGLGSVQATTGPFEMMTPAGFLRDEGLARSGAIMGRALSRAVYLKKMIWLMSKLTHAVPYLGYIIITGIKPDATPA